MKLVILGATGNTGKSLVTQALETGHEVTAVVRDQSKLPITHERLTFESANIFSDTSLEAVFSGKDAVMSCLGATSGERPITLLRNSVKVIVAAMRKCQVTRLILMSSMCTVRTSTTPFLWKLIFRRMIAAVLEDMKVMEDFLVDECPDITFTVVKPSVLANKALANKEVKASEGQEVVGGSFRMPRPNVAKFMLTCLNTSEWDRKLVAIAL